MKTLVVGLGNPILTDDGVGVRVAHDVASMLAREDLHDVTVTEASVGGLRLMELMVGYDRAILIDAIVSSGSEPGAVLRLTLDDLHAISATQHTASAHDTNLITALDAGTRMGLSLPKEVVVFAVEANNVLDFGNEPTPAVAEAIPLVASEVLGELRDGSQR
jgi:hydrogenase maturation protease